MQDVLTLVSKVSQWAQEQICFGLRTETGCGTA
jgi:hypothetical protein